jgi:hypothetical protein
LKWADPHNYLAFYGFQGARKFQAATLLLANRTFATRTLASPAHGMITRPMRTYSRMRPAPMLLETADINRRFFPIRPGL